MPRAHLRKGAQHPTVIIEKCVSLFHLQSPPTDSGDKRQVPQVIQERYLSLVKHFLDKGRGPSRTLNRHLSSLPWSGVFGERVFVNLEKRFSNTLHIFSHTSLVGRFWGKGLCEFGEEVFRHATHLLAHSLGRAFLGKGSLWIWRRGFQTRYTSSRTLNTFHPFCIYIPKVRHFLGWVVRPCHRLKHILHLLRIPMNLDQACTGMACETFSQT